MMKYVVDVQFHVLVLFVLNVRPIWPFLLALLCLIKREEMVDYNILSYPIIACHLAHHLNISTQ